jgi:ribosomal protein S11
MRVKVRFTTLYDNSKTQRVEREECFVADGSDEREQAIRDLIEARDRNAQIVDIVPIDDRLVFGVLS